VSQPTPTPTNEPTSAPDPGPAEAQAPLNRAARRAKAAQKEPAHVGPRDDHARQARGGRAHTKRRS
jgi:hypothetical protein